MISIRNTISLGIIQCFHASDVDIQCIFFGVTRANEEIG